MLQTIKMESQSGNIKCTSKMASEMAAIKALKAYLTNKLDKKYLILTFYGCLEAL